MYSEENIKRERVQIYFDCICGIICSLSALIGIFVFVLPGVGIQNITFFVIGASFWLGYLCLSCFLIGVGVYTYYKSKNYSPDNPPKKKLKAPMVS